MSQLRIYRNGKPDWLQEGPAYARVSGYGGSAVGHALTPMKLPQRSAVPLREKDRRRKERREQTICGAFMPLVREPCARIPGHRDSHRSRRSMTDDSKRRATGKANGRPRTVAA
jgi:hypothetical protein